MMRVRVNGADFGFTELLATEARKTLLDLHTDLVMKTAVDTGYLRSMWTVDTKTLRIENNAEYAMVIMEYGHSKQTPRMTLTNTIEKHLSR